MSDAKAKAEARRAKILARESSRLMMAKGELETLNSEEVVDEKPVKVRPLAARRSLVKSTSKSDVPTADDEDVPASNLADQQDTSDAPNKKVEETESTAISDSRETENKGDEGEEKPSMIPNSVREVEAEIARNTALFDENMKNEGDSKFKEREAKKSKSKPTKIDPPKYVVASSQVLRLLRAILVIVFGVWLGLSSAFSTPELSYSEPAFTWTNWVKNKATQQLGCSVTTVLAVWWLASLATPLVNSNFPSSSSTEKKGVLAMVMSLYTNGLQDLEEWAIGLVGEVALHVFIAIFTAVIVAQLASRGFVVLPEQSSSFQNGVSVPSPSDEF